MENNGNINEFELIRLSQKGDGEAFRKLIEQYRRQLFGYLFKILKDKLNAEDAFQETMYKVWKNIVNYNEKAKFASWLFSIAHNSAMDSIRKNNIRIHDTFNEEFMQRDQGNDPHSELIAEETQNLLRTAVDQLPVKQQRVFIMRQETGLSFKEISEALNEPLNSVLSHMRYASKKIKKFLEEKNEYKRIN